MRVASGSLSCGHILLRTVVHFSGYHPFVAHSAKDYHLNPRLAWLLFRMCAILLIYWLGVSFRVFVGPARIEGGLPPSPLRFSLMENQYWWNSESVRSTKLAKTCVRQSRFFGSLHNRRSIKPMKRRIWLKRWHSGMVTVLGIRSRWKVLTTRILKIVTHNEIVWG
jgi:hypothetical protein